MYKPTSCDGGLCIVTLMFTLKPLNWVKKGKCSINRALYSMMWLSERNPTVSRSKALFLSLWSALDVLSSVAAMLLCRHWR